MSYKSFWRNGKAIKRSMYSKVKFAELLPNRNSISKWPVSQLHRSTLLLVQTSSTFHILFWVNVWLYWHIFLCRSELVFIWISGYNPNKMYILPLHWYSSTKVFQKCSPNSIMTQLLHSIHMVDIKVKSSVTLIQKESKVDPSLFFF